MFDGRQPMRTKHGGGSVSLVRRRRKPQRIGGFCYGTAVGAEGHAGLRKQNRQYRSKCDEHGLRHGVSILAPETRVLTQQNCSGDGKTRRIGDPCRPVRRIDSRPQVRRMVQISCRGQSTAQDRERRSLRPIERRWKEKGRRPPKRKEQGCNAEQSTPFTPMIV